MEAPETLCYDGESSRAPEGPGRVCWPAAPNLSLKGVTSPVTAALGAGLAPLDLLEDYKHRLDPITGEGYRL